MSKLTHIDKDGRPRMVDVSEKQISRRTAAATGKVLMSEAAFALSCDNPKGNPVTIAELAGIMGAKKTSDLIPLCHPLPLSKAKVSISALTDQIGYEVRAAVKTDGKTGVEMEALMAVSTACLTLYDMLKAADKMIEITDIKLIEKTGGKSGPFRRED